MHPNQINQIYIFFVSQFDIRCINFADGFEHYLWFIYASEIKGAK